jgi:predicted nuclease of predicted toxin-antitoxin system
LPVRLLFDENLAQRLVDDLREQYPGSTHVIEHLGQGASDDAIWEFARGQGFTIVTKDEDFHRLSVMRGAPPKVVWILLDNCSTTEIRDLLRRKQTVMEYFFGQEDATFLALG